MRYLKHCIIAIPIILIISCGSNKDNIYPKGDGPLKKGDGQFTLNLNIPANAAEVGINRINIIRKDSPANNPKNDFTVSAIRLKSNTVFNSFTGDRLVLFKVTNNLPTTVCFVSLITNGYLGNDASRRDIVRIWGSLGFSGQPYNSCLTSGETGYSFYKRIFEQDQKDLNDPVATGTAGSYQILEKVDYAPIGNVESLGKVTDVLDANLELANKKITASLKNIGSRKLYVCLGNKLPENAASGSIDVNSSLWGAAAYFDADGELVTITPLITPASADPIINSGESTAIETSYYGLERAVTKIMLFPKYYFEKCYK